MILQELKDWINTLPEEFMEFHIVNGEEGQLDGKYFYRLDKPVGSLVIDKESKEFILLSPKEELFNNDEINEIRELGYPDKEGINK
jgi:hypothetical protein